jgi:hypothetical protein
LNLETTLPLYWLTYLIKNLIILPTKDILYPSNHLLTIKKTRQIFEHETMTHILATKKSEKLDKPTKKNMWQNPNTHNPKKWKTLGEKPFTCDTHTHAIEKNENPFKHPLKRGPQELYIYNSINKLIFYKWFYQFYIR